MTSFQTAFQTPEERTREILDRAQTQFSDIKTVNIACSGGMDSTVAAAIMCEEGPKYGLEPTHLTHIRTGTGLPQSRVVARTIAAKYDLKYIEQGYRNESGSLAVRVLNNGWCGGYAGSPATGGHGLEWANRKDKPMNAVYMQFDGMQLWISGTRKLESKKRQGNVPDSGIEQDKPRRVWLSPIVGWTKQDKKEYIQKHNLPVSESYLILGYSGECTACAFDERGLLTAINLLCPELAYSIKRLSVWLYQRAKRGEVNIDPKQLCWGWEPDGEPERSDQTTTQGLVGCDEESCKDRNAEEWVLSLDQKQIVDRQDVLEYWQTGSVDHITARIA